LDPTIARVETCMRVIECTVACLTGAHILTAAINHNTEGVAASAMGTACVVCKGGGSVGGSIG
jgi:hypothetical protein